MFHCDRFEAMLTEPDTMGIVSEAEEHDIGAELRSASELIEALLAIYLRVSTTWKK